MRYACLAFALASAACGNSIRSWDSAVVDSNPPLLDVVITSVPDSKLRVDVDPCSLPLQTDPELCSHGYYQRGSRYDLSLSVDAGNCNDRPTVACDGTCAGPTLYSQMMQVIGSCGFVPTESSAGVTFSQGCAQQVFLENPGYNEEAVTACILSALSASKFACAEQFPCWGLEFSTLAF